MAAIIPMLHSLKHFCHQPPINCFSTRKARRRTDEGCYRVLSILMRGQAWFIVLFLERDLDTTCFIWSCGSRSWEISFPLVPLMKKFYQLRFHIYRWNLEKIWSSILSSYNKGLLYCVPLLQFCNKLVRLRFCLTLTTDISSKLADCSLLWTLQTCLWN